MTRAVVLEHTLPDASVHFDWMLEHPDQAGDRPLLTWRVAERPDRAADFPAERIGPHRSVYLSYEGDVSGGRGRVRRLAEGTVDWERLNDQHATLGIRWSEAGFRRYVGRAVGGGVWRFAAGPG